MRCQPARRARGAGLTFGQNCPFTGLVSCANRAKMALDGAVHGRPSLELDNRMKQLLQKLGHAINDSVAESDRIAEAISGVRAAGFEIVLKLDATIGLARKSPDESRMTSQDRRFLESMHIRVDEEAAQEEPEKKVTITAQDIRFLKSLKISFD